MKAALNYAANNHNPDVATCIKLLDAGGKKTLRLFPLLHLLHQWLPHAKNWVLQMQK